MERRVNRGQVYRYNGTGSSEQVRRVVHNDNRYSLEEVKDWCERMLDSKLKYLHREIAQNNETIRKLTERLRHTERELDRKEHLLQTLTARTPSNKADIVEVTNKLLNDKLREKFEDVNKIMHHLQHLDMNRNRIIQTSHNDLEGYQQKMQQKINKQIFDIKTTLRQKCQEIKKGNSVYWNKIKGWAKMFEQKLAKAQKNTEILIRQSDRLEDNINNSVMSIYKLKSFNTRFKEIELAIYDLEESFKVISETQLELKQLVQGNNRIQLSYSKDEFTYRLDDFNSKLDDEYQMATSYPVKQSSYQSNYQNHYPNNIQNSQPVSTQNHYRYQTPNIPHPTKPVHSSPVAKEPQSYRPNLSPVASQEGFKINQENSLVSSGKSEFGQFQAGTHEVSRASFKSMALSQTSEYRREMMVNLRQRLETMIQQKRLQTPIQCFLDEINLLKNSFNNYIFDLKGNLFKMKKDEFEQLCSQGILKRIG